MRRLATLLVVIGMSIGTSASANPGLIKKGLPPCLEESLPAHADLVVCEGEHPTPPIKKDPPGGPPEKKIV